MVYHCGVFMIELEALRERVAAHIPTGTPPSEEYVPSYYFRCDCRRTEKHLRFAVGDSWHQQTHRRRRIPVLDAEGIECGYRLAGEDVPRDQRYEPLAKPIPMLGEMVGHPKPWLSDANDDADTSHENGDYCWGCAVKEWEAAFRMKYERGYAPRDICDPIRSNYESRGGGCCICGVRFDGDPEDLDDEIAHFTGNLPDCASDWQQVDRLLDVFDMRECEDSDDGQSMLERIARLVETAERLEAISDKIERLVFVWTWDPTDDQFFRDRAAELVGNLEPVLSAWQQEHDRLKAIRARLEGLRWEDMSDDQKAEHNETAGYWRWSTAATALRHAMGLPSPVHRRTYQSHLPKLVDPAGHVEALAMKYYRDSFRVLQKRKAKMVERWLQGTRRYEWVAISGAYTDAQQARHAALCAEKTRRWQYLLKRLGEPVARRWVAALLAEAERLDYRL